MLAAVASIHARAPAVAWTVVAVAPLLVAALLVFAPHQALMGPGLSKLGAAIPALVFFVAGFASLMLLPRQAAIAAFLVCFGLGNAEAALSRERYMVENSCRIGPTLSAAVIDLNRFLASDDPRLQKTSLWFQDDEGLALAPGCTLSVEYLGYSLQASGIPNIADNPYPMPSAADISEGGLRDIAASGRRLGVLTADEEVWRAVVRRVTELGLVIRPAATRTVSFSGHEVVLTLADVKCP